MVYIRGVMLHPSMARLATVENLCNMLPTWFVAEVDPLPALPRNTTI